MTPALNRGCLLIFSVLALPVIAPTAEASSLDGNGSVSGRVLDSRGGVIQQVAVTLRNQETGIEQIVSTDLVGAFRFEDLPSAPYYLSTEKKNFQSVVQEILLFPSQNRRVDLTLNIDSQALIRERVMVIGEASTVGEIPGSAHYINQENLESQQLAFDDIHQILRQVPGVNVQEEDGYGLRPNIGMRGTGAERSSKITLMEDGVLIAPAPYAAPAAYYFPVTGRMDAIEVRKGSSQIKYGPKTTGGAINLISTGIPEDFNLKGNLALGVDDSRKLHLNLGDSYKHFAWVAETYQMATDGFKELDGGGHTGFEVNDYLAKFRLHSGGSARIYQELEVKLGKTQQLSEETYLGLTDTDFAANPLRRYRGSQQDVFQSDHEQYQARYFIVPARSFDVTAILYRNNFQRNWYKLQSVSGTEITNIFNDPEAHSAELAIAKGADSDPDALAVRANDREYYSQGIQSILGWQQDLGNTRNRFELGFRYHKDEEDRFQHEDGFQMQNGTMVLTTKGAPGSQSNRLSGATAWALSIQDKIERGKWTLSPGLRYEDIDLFRTDFSTSDPERLAPTRIRKSGVQVFVPGFGLNFQAAPALGLFGGLHKGFAPPGPGSHQETQAEESLNYEFGVRIQSLPLSLEVAGFVNDYDNLLGVDTLAAGGSGEGDLFNGGEVLVMGLEASGSADLGERFGLSVRVPVHVAYTFTNGEFKNGFESDFEPWGNVVVGDELPYLPRHQFNARIGLERARWRLAVEAHAVSRMRTKAGQGPIPRLEATDGYLVFGLSGEYDLTPEKKGVSLFLSVSNLTDQAYITARRPAGARPGLPRTFMGGLKFRLGR